MAASRIGVFVCHCGINIASTVDTKKVVEEISKYPSVVFATNYVFMCSDSGQQTIAKAVKEHNLDAVVVAACSPSLHETTFRRLVTTCGLNPYQCECANIREHCSWVHPDKEKATAKAVRIINAMVDRIRGNKPLTATSVPVTKRALVVGAGIAGIQTALDIADAGYETIVVEKTPWIGGHMAQLSETFPTLDCSQCILTPRMVEIVQHKNIKLYTYSEIKELIGFVGNFEVKIRKKAKSIDESKCTGCGFCQEKCPTKVPSEFNAGLGVRKAIYTPTPQAVPKIPVLDRENCTWFKKKKCGVCKKACPAEAVNYEQEDTIITEKVGAVIVATGYDLYPKEKLGEYGYGKVPDVIDSLAFERLLSATGPTEGEIKRPSDGMVPKDVVFIQCCGSRDPEHHLAYCSKVCCMYTTKHALLYKHRVHDGQPYVFYIDIRAGGKGYEEFYHRAAEEERILYIRGKVSRVFREGDKIIVWGVDTLTAKKIEVAADLVVLAMGMQPSSGTREIAAKLKVITSADGFFGEAHPKLRPVETLTAGVFIAGCAQAPKDIPETVTQASGAASKVKTLFSRETLERDPLIAILDEELCAGCGLCINVCPYGARILNEERKIVEVNVALCEGCGACAAVCPSGATEQANSASLQIMKMLCPLNE
ncbi:MAG: CoB--CoM heterodisulfide reductase iron-sulfur subunit A family protein [Planctomycetota bacterium]